MSLQVSSKELVQQTFLRRKFLSWYDRSSTSSSPSLNQEENLTIFVNCGEPSCAKVQIKIIIAVYVNFLSLFSCCTSRCHNTNHSKHAYIDAHVSSCLPFSYNKIKHFWLFKRAFYSSSMARSTAHECLRQFVSAGKNGANTCKTGSCALLLLRNTDWPEQTREHRIYNSIQLPAFRHTISVVLKVQCNRVNVA